MYAAADVPAQQSRDWLTGEPPEESPANIFLRLSDFHAVKIMTA